MYSIHYNAHKRTIFILLYGYKTRHISKTNIYISQKSCVFWFCRKIEKIARYNYSFVRIRYNNGQYFIIMKEKQRMAKNV